MARRNLPQHDGDMKLSEKGRFIAPPSLPAAAQLVADAIAGWEGVHPRTHWQLGDERVVDGADFYYGEDELGHIHLDAEAYIMLPSQLAAALVRARVAHPLPWSTAAVVCPIESAADAETAIWLFGLSYARRRGTSAAELISQLRAALGRGDDRAL